MDLKKVLEVSNEPSVKSNKDLEEGLKYLNEEFEKTKFSIVELTKHMDKIEKRNQNIKVKSLLFPNK